MTKLSSCNSAGMQAPPNDAPEKTQIHCIYSLFDVNLLVTRDTNSVVFESEQKSCLQGNDHISW